MGPDAMDNFAQRRIKRVFQQVQTIVEYEQLDENDQAETHEVVVSSYRRDLPEPLEG